MDTNENLASKIKELMDQGKTLEEALNECNVKAASGKKRERIEDRVTYIKSLTNIVEVRKASKAAFAKRSKAKDEAAENRYGDEIVAAKERLAELVAMINQADDPLAKAIELGEEPSGVVQRMLDKYRDADENLSTILKKANMPRKTAKDLMKNIPATKVPQEIQDTLNKLGPEYLPIYEARVGRNDQRCITINRILNFMADFKVENKPEAPKSSKGKASGKK